MYYSYKNAILILGLIFCTTITFSQTKEIDSLKNELQNHKTQDTLKVDLLYKLAFSHFQRDMKSTLLYLGEAEDLSNDLNYIKGKAKVLYLKGILESRKSNYTTSLNYFNKSLKHYQSINDKKGESAIYSAFGITHFIQSEFDEAIISYKKASKILEELGDQEEMINSLLRVANVYNEIGKYDKALPIYKKTLKHYKLIQDEFGVSLIHNSLGFLYNTQGNYPLAIDYYNEALDYRKKTKDTLGIIIGLNNLGNTYISINKNYKALEYLKQSLKLSLLVGNKAHVAIANGNIGDIYLQQKNFKNALKHFETSLKISTEINQQQQSSLSLNSIGQVNLYLNRPLIARENYIKAININKKIDYKRGLSLNFIGIAETYIYRKQYEEAIFNIEKAKSIADELKLIEIEKKASELLCTINEANGNYKKALENHKLYKTLNDSLFNKENIEKITQLEYEYKYKKALDSASIRELKLNKTVKAVNQDLEKSQRNLLLGIIAFLGMVLILGGIIFSLKLKHAQTKTQNIMVEQKLLRSQMTPHFIFNSLSVLQGIILNKEDKKSVSYLSKFSKLLRTILENSRYKTVPLSDELSAIDSYMTLQNLDVDPPFEYNLTIAQGIDKAAIEIPPMLIQPFIENAIEHAFPNKKEDKKISVQLAFKDDELVCTIQDNGIGIDFNKQKSQKNKNSLATTITSERLEMLAKEFKTEGSLSVNNKKEFGKQGTLVTLVIPHKTQSII